MSTVLCQWGSLYELFSHLGQDAASTKSETHQAGFNSPWNAWLTTEDRRKSELGYSHRSNHLNHSLHTFFLGLQGTRVKKRLSRRVRKHSIPEVLTKVKYVTRCKYTTLVISRSFFFKCYHSAVLKTVQAITTMYKHKLYI